MPLFVWMFVVSAAGLLWAQQLQSRLCGCILATAKRNLQKASCPHMVVLVDYRVSFASGWFVVDDYRSMGWRFSQSADWKLILDSTWSMLWKISLSGGLPSSKSSDFCWPVLVQLYNLYAFSSILIMFLDHDASHTLWWIYVVIVVWIDD